MKTLKLEVGKTYRSRRGEEVKIIGKDRGVRCIYKGSDGARYAESGRFNYSTENPRDLIETLPETRHTFSIPDGVKKVTVEQVGNRIVVEMALEEVEPKPKTMQVEDIPERERIMDFLQGYVTNVKMSSQKLCWLIEAYINHREGKK